MKTLKAFLDVVVIGYIIFTVLLLAGAIDENAILDPDVKDQALTLYKILVAGGGILLLARVLMSSLYVAEMQHDRYRAQLKINELKASLYEKRQAFRSNSYKKEALAQEEVEVLN